MTIKELIDAKNIKTLMAVYFNLVDEDNDSFIVRSEYRESKFASVNRSDFDTINNNLCQYFGLEFISTDFGKHTARIKKTSEIDTADKFLSLIYRQIQLLSFDTETKEYEEAVMMALFAMRGSVDFTAQYYAVDIYRKYSTKEYIRNIFQILSGIGAISQLNLNFREYQPQFTDGSHQRNTQIRVKLGWFWNKYGKTIGEINSYKYSILRNNTEKIAEPSMNIGNFSDRLVEYLKNVLGEVSQSVDIEKERQRLGLAAAGTESRDYNLKTLAGSIFPDECMSCKNRFDTDSRTFKMRGRDKYYFEIHHIIPFSKGKEHDQIDNLAKICPVCHRVLTKGRAEEWLQRQTIADILSNSDNAREYVGVLAGSSNINDLVDFVYLKLV